MKKDHDSVVAEGLIQKNGSSAQLGTQLKNSLIRKERRKGLVHRIIVWFVLIDGIIILQGRLYDGSSSNLGRRSCRRWLQQ
jgi:hypothetical protein